MEESLEYTVDKSIILERMLVAFQTMFGIPKGAVRTKFRQIMQETVLQKYPGLASSTARMIFEGKIPGLSKPIDKPTYAWRRQLGSSLFLLDCFEQVAHDAFHTRAKQQKEKANVQEPKTVVPDNRPRIEPGVLIGVQPTDDDVRTTDGATPSPVSVCTGKRHGGKPKRRVQRESGIRSK